MTNIRFLTFESVAAYLRSVGITTQGEMIAAGIRVREVRCG